MRTFLLSLALAIPALAAPLEWHADYEAALAEANASVLDVLAYVGGSAWNPRAKEVREQLLSAPEFEAFASRRFACVEIDRPYEKPTEPSETDKRNAKMGVEVYNIPSVVLLDRAGRCYGLLGPEQLVSPAALVERLGRLVEARLARDGLWGRAEAAEGAEKARLLGEGLALLEPAHIGRYRPVLEATKTADPEDATGYTFRFSFDPAGFAEGEIWPRCDQGKQDEALALIERRLGNPVLTTIQRQQLLAARYQVQHRSKQGDESLATLRALVALDPSTDMAAGARGLLDYFTKPIRLSEGRWLDGDLRTRPVVWIAEAGEWFVSAGSYEVRFVRDTGDNVDTTDLALYADETLLARAEPLEANGFRLVLAEAPTGGALTLRVSARGDGWWLGGTGHIEVTRQP